MPTAKHPLNRGIHSMHRERSSDPNMHKIRPYGRRKRGVPCIGPWLWIEPGHGRASHTGQNNRDAASSRRRRSSHPVGCSNRSTRPTGSVASSDSQADFVPSGKRHHRNKADVGANLNLRKVEGNDKAVAPSFRVFAKGWARSISTVAIGLRQKTKDHQVP